MSATNSPNKQTKQRSQYDLFRQAKYKEYRDDDNISAHFSNPLQQNMTDREQDLSILNKKTHNTNAKINRNFNKDVEDKNIQITHKLHQKQRQCNQLYAKYGQLLKKYEQSQKQVQYYKNKYEQKLLKDKETKLKLQGWIRSAKSDLLQAP